LNQAPPGLAAEPPRQLRPPRPSGPIGLRPLEPLTLAGLGALQTLACVHTWAWWLPLLTLAVLAWRLDRVSPRRAAWLGWCYGCAWLVAGTWWLYISMHRYGDLPAPLAALAVLALSAALSLYLSVAAWLYARLRRGRLWVDALLFAAVLLLAEWARGVVFTGFPWVAAGYSQVDAPLATLAPWVGVYGVGAALAFAAALVGALPRVHRRARATLVAAVVAFVTLPGVPGHPQFSSAAGTVSVSLLQPNVQQDEKFAADRLPQTLSWVATTLRTAPGALVVTPETAVPLLPDQLEQVAPGYWQALTQHFAQPGRAALVGVPLGSFEQGYTNSVLGLAQPAAAAPYRYDKHHLVPFGEFIPTGFRWFTELMNIPLGDFNRGAPVPPSFSALGQRWAPNICYEDLFGEELARRFVDPATAPTVLVNVSNIAWFGDTVAIPQHRNISRFRTLELQRPMVRATNTGATAFIDHTGRVTAALAPFTTGVLDGEVQGREGTTPFAWWAGRFGLWPLLGLALLVVLWVGLLQPARTAWPPTETSSPAP
jgi:apolipoprotein N-acyltransferase